MFTHCLTCKVELPDRGALERGVPGDPVAYDPRNGRLWSVCPTCRSWSLVPFAERWEAVEEFERIITAGPGSSRRARLLARTDNVELFGLGEVRIVRVGQSDRVEEAWWRYGREMQRRWRPGGHVTPGRAVTLGAAIVGGVLSAALPARYAFRRPAEVRRWLRFGERAWTGQARCAACGHPFTEVTYFDRTILRLRPQDEHLGPALVRPCPACGDVGVGGLHLGGLVGEQTLRRVLAYAHFDGAPEARIRGALQLVEREGSPSRMIGVLVRHTEQLGDLPPVAATALEVAANEARERRLLELEARALDSYWREAEAVAAIVDGELTPVSGLERLRRSAARDL